MKGLILYRNRPVGEVTFGAGPKGVPVVLWKDTSKFDDGPIQMIGQVNTSAVLFKNGPKGAIKMTLQEKLSLALREAMLSACQSLVDQGADMNQIDTVTLDSETVDN